MPYIYEVVMSLRDFGGFSTREVSQILRIKESTVKAWQWRRVRAAEARVGHVLPYTGRSGSYSLRCIALRGRNSSRYSKQSLKAF